MSENPNNPFENDDEEMDTLDDMGMTDYDLLSDDENISVIQETMGVFLDAATVESAYGEPIQNGDTMIIPTAEVLALMGFGVGSGYGSGSAGDEESSGTGGGSGGGGGGRVLSRPVAVVIASPEGVRIEPVFDMTKIALAALTAFGFMFGFLMRMRRGKMD